MPRPDLTLIAGRIESVVTGIWDHDQSLTLTPDILHRKLELLLATAAELRIAEQALQRAGKRPGPGAVVFDLSRERDLRAVAAVYRELGLPAIAAAPTRLPSDNLRMPRNGLVPTPPARSTDTLIRMAELALVRRNEAVFARLREAAELNPELTATLLDRASSTILEEVSRATPASPVGDDGRA